MPFIKIEDMFSPRIVSIPFSDFCDPIVKDSGQWDVLIESLLKEKLPISVRCLHTRIPLQDERFEQVNRANWHGLELNNDLDTIFKNFHSASRRAIRKAERNGTTVRQAENETDLRAFFEMHLQIRKYKYKMVAQSYQFLLHIWRNFVETGQGVLLLAERENKIIGGVFYLRWQNKLYYKFNASSLSAQDLRPNDLLMWEGIKYAKTNNCTFLDLGLSDWGQDGLVRYKQKYATNEKTIYFLKHIPNETIDCSDKQMRGLLPKLTALFTDESVPDEITEKAGDLLYRYFT